MVWSFFRLEVKQLSQCGFGYQCSTRMKCGLQKDHRPSFVGGREALGH